MNPETRISSKQIQQLCEMHSINYVGSERVEVGFSNEIHSINEELILKFYQQSGRRYEIELTVLQHKTSFPKPKVIAHGYANDIVDQAYIFMNKIPGAPLGHVWHEINDGQREALIRQFIESQKEIASFDPDEFGFNTEKTWYDTLINDAQKQITKLLSGSILTRKEADLSIKLIKDAKDILQTKETFPVFWDIHLDNLLVDDKRKLIGIIDFEHVKYAALDYPLFILRKLINDPAKFATEDNEKYTNTEHYKPIWNWYQMYYPKMFEFENQDERIKVYELLDCLRLLKQWSHDPKLVDRFHELIG